MTRTMSIPFALAAIALTTAGSGACDTKPDLNPALGAYQDETNCFPFRSHLHQIYRNFKKDPYLGGTAKCVKANPTGPLVNYKVKAYFQYGSDGVLNTTITVASTPGYKARNLLKFKVDDDSKRRFNFTAAYRDCKKCKIFRHWYIDNGNGCSYWVTDEALGKEVACCEYVYELLCGTSPKYEIYDESCR